MANAEHGSKSHVVGMVILNAFRPTHNSAKSPRDPENESENDPHPGKNMFQVEVEFMTLFQVENCG